MIINIKDLKNKIIYRANYRGTKEMDKLMGSFTRIYINQLSDNEIKPGQVLKIIIKAF